MLTLFTTARPFQGHIGIIQRNALKSWTLLHPDAGVILFGDDLGAAEVAGELGIRHEPRVERAESGWNRLDDMVRKAEAMSPHEILCYSNSDIVLTDDFRRAVEKVAASYPKFVMVGRRWNTPITQPIDFSAADWAQQVRRSALSANRRSNGWWIDYFVFSRGLYANLPPFVIGAIGWDNWVVWKGLASKVPVVDASPDVLAVHQDHDYKRHPQGKLGVWTGQQSQWNLKLAGGRQHLRKISDATVVLRRGRLSSNPMRHWQTLLRLMNALYYGVLRRAWFFCLDITRPLRSVLGLRSQQARRKGPAGP